MGINFSNMYATHIQSFNLRLLYFLGYHLTKKHCYPCIAASYPLN